MKEQIHNAVLLICLLSCIELINSQCRLTCLQTDNSVDSTPYSNVWSPSSLVFILDTTESMINEIQLVRREVNGILNTINDQAQARACKPVDNYIIYPFNDPKLGPMYRSETVADFEVDYAEVETQVQGGGDCPEPVLTAVLNVLDNVTDNSFVFIFTDGAAKDARLKLQLIKKIQQTNSFVVFVLIGDHCSNEGLAYIGSQLYNQITHASGGNAFFLQRTSSTVGNVVKLVSLFVKPKSVSIIEINQFTPSDCMQIPVDPSLCDLVVTVKNPTFRNIGRASLHSPGTNGKVPHKVRTRSLKAWEIDGPTAGNWRICFGKSKNRILSLQVRGSSDINFEITLRDPLTRSELTEVRGGEAVQMNLRIFGISTENIHLLEFIDLEGNVIEMIDSFVRQISIPIITVSRIVLPSGIFRIRISGTDETNNEIERVSNGIFGEPNEPTWVIEPPSNVYAVLQKNFTIEAVVTGEPTPTIVWEKENVVLNVNNRIEIERFGSLKISRVIDTDTGSYSITATNQAGSIRKNIRLSLWTAPYFTINPQQEIEGKVNQPLIIDLNPQGTPQPSCRWLYKGSPVEGFGRCSYHIRVLNDLTCGAYKVIVENSVASISFPITVTFEPACYVGTCHYKPPLVGAIIMLQTNCVGCPTRCQWMRNSVQINNSSKHTIYSNCSLAVRNFQSTDKGDYRLNLIDKDSNIGDEKVIKVNNQQSLAIIEPDWNERLVQVGTNFEVVCRATGFPLPILSWSRNGRPINKVVPLCTDATSQSLGLKFTKIQKQSEGEYKCTATNRFENIEKKVIIKVNSTLDVDVTPSIAEVTIGEIVFIHCQITNRGPLNPSVMWYISGEALRNDRITIFSNNTLKFEPVLGGDEGRYECRAVTSREVTSGYTELKPTPKTFYYDPINRDTACMICPLLAGNNPIWIRNRNQLGNNKKHSITGREICIQRAECADEGTYVCERIYPIPVRLRDSQDVCKNLVRQRPRFRYRQPAFVITSGHTATMTCNVTGVPKPTINWFRNRTEKLVNDHRTKLSLTSSYTPGDTSFVYESTVVIEKITLGDQGRYSCNASHRILGYSNHTFLMQVTLPDDADRPYLSQKSGNMEICAGEDFALYCRFNSTLTPISYRWYFKYQRIMSSGNSIISDSDEEKLTNLRITNPSTAQTGTYTCEARNILGNARDSIYVRVNEPIVVTISYFSGDTTAYIGEPLTLYCRVSSSASSVRISWHKDGEFLSSGERMRFDRVESDIAGMYTCRVSGCGPAKERSLVVQVRGSVAPQISYISPAQTVIDGDPAILHCIASGDPQPTIIWKRGTRVLSENSRIDLFDNGTMVIERTYTDIDQNDQYICEAENTLGKVTDTTSLIVITVEYLFVSRIKVSPGKTVSPGSTITLDCIIDGVPVEEFSWFHNDNTLTSGGRFRIDSSRRLTIREITLSHSGEYKCVASNRYPSEGSQAVMIYVGTGSAPELDENAPTSLNGRLGDTITVNCPFTSTLSQSFVWEKDRKRVKYISAKRVLSANGSLVIYDFSISDAGEYVCISRNSLGSGRYEVSVLLPVTWLRRPGGAVSVAEGDNLVVNLEVVAYPQVSIIWSRDGTVVNNSRYKFTNNNATLTIIDVGREDAGTYLVEIRQEIIIRGKDGNPDTITDSTESVFINIQQQMI